VVPNVKIQIHGSSLYFSLKAVDFMQSVLHSLTGYEFAPLKYKNKESGLPTDICSQRENDLTINPAAPFYRQIRTRREYLKVRSAAVLNKTSCFHNFARFTPLKKTHFQA
jgi:hypothetical protein